MRLSTKKLAKHLKVETNTLLRWIREGGLKAPPLQSVEGGGVVRLWGPADIKRAKDYCKRRKWKKDFRRRAG
jgi:predicted site-specific integrase-resolvase